VQPSAQGAAPQLGRQLVDAGGEAVGEDLAVAVGAELGGEPAQLVVERLGGVGVPDGRVRPEAAAEAAGGDAHLVDGVGLFAADGGVELDEGAQLAAGVGQDVGARGAVGERRGAAGLGRCGVASGRGLGEGAVQLGGVGGAGEAGGGEAFLHGVEEGGAAGDGAGGELDLDLGPVSRVAAALGGDLVDGELCEHPARLVEQLAAGALGAQGEEGEQRGLPGAGAHQAGQGRGGRLAQRRVDLLPDAGGDGELEVPAGVVAAGAAAQRDAVGGQVLGRGVVVDGLQAGGVAVPEGGHGSGPGQLRGRGGVGDLVLALGLCAARQFRDGSHAVPPSVPGDAQVK
jgi:hypothetical protein